MRFFAFALMFLAVTTQAAPKVLVCAAESATVRSDITAKLGALKDFASVTALDCGSGGSTPDLATLKTYDAVLVWDDYYWFYPYKDRITLGNSLADYVDAGGGVVQVMWNYYTNYDLGGRWSSDGYSCIKSSFSYTSSTKTLAAQPSELGSPLTTGVTTMGTARSLTSVQLANGATPVWTFTDSTPAIVRCTPKGRPRIDLNLDV